MRYPQDDSLYINTLQCRIRALRSRNDDFESGKIYQKMRAEMDSIIHECDVKVTKARHEAADAERRIRRMNANWMDVLDDVIDEYEEMLSAKDKDIKMFIQEISKLYEIIEKLKTSRDEWHSKYDETAKELEKKEDIEDALRAQLRMDHENSSKPSSQVPNHAKIPNSREKTGKKPGGQPGHKGTSRKKQVADETVKLEPPAMAATDADLKPTGKQIVRQMVSVNVSIHTIEYIADEYRNSRTGQRVHAPFPTGVINDVNYDGSIKGFLFLLNSECNVSISKCSRLLRELTDGKLEISTGMISGLCREFSKKTKSERRQIFQSIQNADIANIDFTSVRINGKRKQICISAAEENTLYQFREKKGHEGIKGTPVELTKATIVHDHDKTFYSYGSRHQECLAHVIRYLKGISENEPERKWAGKMRKLMQEMVHYRKHWDEGGTLPKDKIADFRKQYEEILEEAEQSYEANPPSKYNRDGFNLQNKMKEYEDEHLLFLEDARVPYTNNHAERLARKVVRKNRQVTTFRSDSSVEKLMDSLSVLMSIGSENRYEKIIGYFNRI